MKAIPNEQDPTKYRNGTSSANIPLFKEIIKIQTRIKKSISLVQCQKLLYLIRDAKDLSRFLCNSVGTYLYSATLAQIVWLNRHGKS
jgi:hypothetical protein